MNSIKRCFDIDPATPNEATVRLFYLSAELNGNDPGSLYVFHETAGEWYEAGGAHTRESDGGPFDWVAVASVQSYSRFTAWDRGPTVVEIVGFQAIPAQNSVWLEWETGSEIGLVGFDLYRSGQPEGPFERLNDGLIAAQRPGSPLGSRYIWHDVDAPAGTSFYRLEQVEQGSERTSYGPVQVSVPYFTFLPLAVN